MQPDHAHRVATRASLGCLLVSLIEALEGYPAVLISKKPITYRGLMISVPKQ